MALTTTAAALATASLLSMYLDARLLLSHDVFSGALSNVSAAAVTFMAQRAAENSLTNYHNLTTQAKHPQIAHQTFLVFEGNTWTYRQFWEDVNRVGWWLIREFGIKRDEVVAIDGANSPEYLMCWFALEAIGAVPAFVNCNLTAGPLIHCIKVSGARIALVDRDLQTLVEPYDAEMQQNGCKIAWYDPHSIQSLGSFEQIGQGLPQSRLDGMKIDDLACVIYTSGTTGFPKGTKLLRGREVNTARTVMMYLGLKPGMRMYTCLPLYHGAAHGLCVTPCIAAGSTVVLGRKFSHKTFWPEVRESQADTVQYVGELCRYLVNAPPNALDKQHNVQMVWGNGMRPDVWDLFRDRFNIPIINELYAATDGIGGSFNYNKGDFGRYAVGKRGYIWHHYNSNIQKRIKIDVVTQEIVRNKDGFAIEAADGQPGEMIMRINPELEKMMFAGYINNEEAGEKRKIRDLFEKGDLWFRSGDLMRQDADGCLYFVDRLGDTFRWKSENVSTSEVGDVLGRFNQIAEANVYGVQVPSADGRCGCGAIVMTEGVTEDKFDFAGLAKYCIGILPRYAVPIFIRVVKELQYTGTMKVQKGKLREEGVNPDKIHADPDCKDTMYWLPPSTTEYVPFRRKDWEELNGGRVRL